MGVAEINLLFEARSGNFGIIVIAKEGVSIDVSSIEAQTALEFYSLKLDRAKKVYTREICITFELRRCNKSFVFADLRTKGNVSLSASVKKSAFPLNLTF